MGTRLINFEARLRQSVEAFWRNRSQATTQQKASGRSDQGNRGAVLGRDNTQSPGSSNISSDEDPIFRVEGIAENREVKAAFPERIFSLFEPVPLVVLTLVWAYMFAWFTFTVITALHAGEGISGLELLILGIALLPVILIPAGLSLCLRQGWRPPLRSWLVWPARLMVVSIVLALIDTRRVVTTSRTPMFSAASWKLKDGGTTGYTGFGYCLTKHQELHGERGPEVWFWFTPFTISYTTKHLGFQWLGTP